MGKQLFRSRNNKMIAGVCGGIAEYFAIDPTIVRLVWVLITLTYGIGLIAYIIAAIVIPDNMYQSYENYEQKSNEEYAKPAVSSDKTNLIIGCILVLIGAFAVLKRFFYWFDFSLLWPVLLIAVGAIILYNGWRKPR
ncbi:phage shock protein C [Oxobacter pfennigii]|uniref:Phage shock protein C n=1 Tax=Oxobacter pfennigii TaxID=36849 RepID=A0A0P8W3V9_9CLOT|nr:PspC domain-containing protein [Oxobacter pfennigii]KPU42289.1 phage shock protein C [Oxobacter pfennigii]